MCSTSDEPLVVSPHLADRMRRAGMFDHQRLAGVPWGGKDEYVGDDKREEHPKGHTPRKDHRECSLCDEELRAFFDWYQHQTWAQEYSAGGQIGEIACAIFVGSYRAVKQYKEAAVDLHARVHSDICGSRCVPECVEWARLIPGREVRVESDS